MPPSTGSEALCELISFEGVRETGMMMSDLDQWTEQEEPTANAADEEDYIL